MGNGKVALVHSPLRLIKIFMKKHIFLFFIVIFSGVVFAQSEDQIVYQLYRSSNGATDLTYQCINYASQAIFKTKDLTGSFKSTGTLTQTSLNPEIWAYSATPTDKLVVKFLNGISIDIVYTLANGYIAGTSSDFVCSHTNFVFSMKIATLLDLNITSQAIYSGNQGDNTVTFSRTIAGSYSFTGTWITLNIANSGTTHTIVDGGTFLQYATNETATGTTSTTSSQTTVNEKYYSMIVFSSISSPSVYSINKILTNNSSITIGGQTYALQNATVKWAAGTQFADSAHAGIYNKAIDINYWQASGSLLKNGVVYGNVYFDTPLILNSYGPKAVVQLANNRLILIHPILQSWVTVTNIKNEFEKLLPTGFDVEQNYPNPFNPSTTIRYSLPEATDVSVTVFDINGTRVTSLVEKHQNSGVYSISWDGKNDKSIPVSSGIYYYRIKAGNYIKTNKMILMK